MDDARLKRLLEAIHGVSQFSEDIGLSEKRRLIDCGLAEELPATISGAYDEVSGREAPVLQGEPVMLLTEKGKEKLETLRGR